MPVDEDGLALRDYSLDLDVKVGKAAKIEAK